MLAHCPAAEVGIWRAYSRSRRITVTSFTVGRIQVQVIFDGLLRENPHDFFVDHQTDQWYAEAGVGPGGIDRLDVQCLLVRVGDRYALLDTGLGLDETSG